jgi:hypothetical protein
MRSGGRATPRSPSDTPSRPWTLPNSCGSQTMVVTPRGRRRPRRPRASPSSFRYAYACRSGPARRSLPGIDDLCRHRPAPGRGRWRSAGRRPISASRPGRSRRRAAGRRRSARRRAHRRGRPRRRGRAGRIVEVSGSRCGRSFAGLPARASEITAPCHLGVDNRRRIRR